MVAGRTGAYSPCCPKTEYGIRFYIFSNYGHKHGLKRKKIYKDEGFKVLEREISFDDEGVVKGLEDLKF